ncbi:hypothetical protein SUDANB120_05110 [Streptomyces sp. enrichment culture]
MPERCRPARGARPAAMDPRFLCAPRSRRPVRYLHGAVGLPGGSRQGPGRSRRGTGRRRPGPRRRQAGAPDPPCPAARTRFAVRSVTSGCARLGERDPPRPARDARPAAPGPRPGAGRWAMPGSARGARRARLARLVATDCTTPVHTPLLTPSAAPRPRRTAQWGPVRRVTAASAASARHLAWPKCLDSSGVAASGASGAPHQTPRPCDPDPPDRPARLMAPRPVPLIPRQPGRGPAPGSDPPRPARGPAPGARRGRAGWAERAGGSTRTRSSCAHLRT